MSVVIEAETPPSDKGETVRSTFPAEGCDTWIDGTGWVENDPNRTHLTPLGITQVIRFGPNQEFAVHWRDGELRIDGDGYVIVGKDEESDLVIRSGKPELR